VNKVKYDWVSTYSYRGWCSLLNLKPKACDQNAIGYTGDLYWAVCDLRYARLVPLLPGRGNPCSMGSPEHRMFVSCLGGYGAYNAASPFTQSCSPDKKRLRTKDEGTSERVERTEYAQCLPLHP
jgi:hypothetical protein